MLSRVLFFVTLMSFSIMANAAPVSPGTYEQVSPPKWRDESEKPKIIKIIKRLAKQQSRRTQLLVLPFNVDAVPTIKKDGGSIKGMNALKTEMIKGGAQIIDRNVISKEVKRELEYIDATGTSRGVNSELADFLFKTEVLSSDARKQYTDSYTYTSDGKTRRTPSACKFTGTATVSVGVYSMNPLELVDYIVLEGSSSRTKTGISSVACDRLSGAGIETDAMKSAVAEGREEIQNLFASKGYIIDLRYSSKGGNPEKGKKMIFRTSLPKKNSTKKGAPVVVYKYVSKTDQLTGETKLEKAKVGTGKIIEALGVKEVWIKMSSSSTAKEVRLGDRIEVDQTVSCKNGVIILGKCRKLKK